MKRSFEIRDAKRSNKLMGYLYFDEDISKYSMKLLKSYDEEPEIFFNELNRQGIVDVPQHLVDNWVRGRVIPPNRQGLRGILNDIGMKEYNVFDLLMYASGRCHMDELYLKEIYLDSANE